MTKLWPVQALACGGGGGGDGGDGGDGGGATNQKHNITEIRQNVVVTDS